MAKALKLDDLIAAFEKAPFPVETCPHEIIRTTIGGSVIHLKKKLAKIRNEEVLYYWEWMPRLG